MNGINLFSPSFGNRPSVFVGREDIVSSFLEGLQEPAGRRERAVVITGQRGMGKTVLLLEIAEKAREQGCIVTSPTISSDDMLERIIEKLQLEGESILDEKKTRLSGGSFGFLGFSAGLQFSREEEEKRSFTYKLTKLVQAINEAGRGVLILVDEIRANSPGIKQLVIGYQELVGLGADVSIAFAGLPGAVSGLLNHKVLTFLNRAHKIELQPLREGDIDAYYMHAFAEAGIVLDQESRRRAVSATEGSPYMMQLIGYYISKYADEEGCVTQEAFDRAITVSHDLYLQDICRTTLNQLSEVDVEFLRSMAVDHGASSISDIAGRLSVSNEYAQRYKKRLIDAGVISQPRRGAVEFAVPLLADYLRTREQ